MGFLASLVTEILQRILNWFLKLLKREIEEQKEIKNDNANAVENAKKVENATTDKERRDAVEDLFNNRD